VKSYLSNNISGFGDDLTTPDHKWSKPQAYPE